MNPLDIPILGKLLAVLLIVPVCILCVVGLGRVERYQEYEN